MKRKIKLFLVVSLLLGSFLMVNLALAEEIEDEIAELKTRISQLEEKEKIAQKEEEGVGLLSGLAEKIEVSGAVEAEVSYLKSKPKGEDEENESDISLSTVEFGLDIDINEYTKAHLLWLWEEGEGPVDLDEGIITLGGTGTFPVYLSVGKLYVPFGNFETHFVSDPLTLEIGETRESAVVVGYANDLMETSFGFFNGDIDKANSDNVIENYVASVVFNPLSGKSKDIVLSLGASYISNIADSNGLEEESTTDNVEDYIGGFNTFLSIGFKNFTLEAEYLTATDEFEAGELNFASMEVRPRAYNIELAYEINDKWEVAGKYEGSKVTDDIENFLPEKRYGVATSYALFKNTTLSWEYLQGEYENGDKEDGVTLQLAVEF